MVRAVAMSAASALCLIWAAGCASTSEPAAKTASAPAASKPDNSASPADADAELAALTKNLPGTLDGEIRRAQTLRSKGDYDEAARSLAQLMLIAPDDARVVGEYGKVLAQQGHSQEALAFLKRAVELQPHEWSLQSALGVAYDQLDDHASARKAYARALALKPGDASVLNNYAVSLMLSGNYVDAQRFFTEATAKGVSNPKIALNLEKLAALEPETDASHMADSPTPTPIQSNLAQPPAIAAARPSVAVAAQASVGKQSAPQGSPAGVTMKPVTMTAALQVPRSAPATASATRTATAAPKPLTSQVVMEQVPFDPLAGPVKRHPVHPAQKLATAAKQQTSAPAQKPAAPPPPSLRTAADSD